MPSGREALEVGVLVVQLVREIKRVVSARVWQNLRGVMRFLWVLEVVCMREVD